MSYRNIILILTSFFIVAFGQPLWSGALGLVASLVGFALFWRVLLDVSDSFNRFWLATAWYGSVQVFQTAWMTSHPFIYIYAVLFFLSAGIGLQFGFLSIWIKPALFKKKRNLVVFASAWVLMEWSRLFLLSGYTLNPAGLALSGALLPLQMASLGGIYFLSFWVILANLFFLRVWVLGAAFGSVSSWLIVALFPYVFGFFHYEYHHERMEKKPEEISVLLVQPAFQVVEEMGYKSAAEMRQLILENWKKMFRTMSRYANRTIDLIVFPEYVISYGTYYAIFPVDEAKQSLNSVFATNGKDYQPSLEEPFAMTVETEHGDKVYVNNAFFAQALANLFKTDVVIGLGDTDKLSPTESISYSAAFHFSPGHQPPGRYEKRMLVPGGEYIPFSFLNSILAEYGIRGALKNGEEAKVFAGAVPFGLSICYEETCGHLVRENRQKGAELLVNLTNDGWFPFSNLPQLHFDHARLRTVENGIPLVRSCNTGVTGAISSLGETIAVLGDHYIDRQSQCDSLLVKVPLYHYKTVYSSLGDWLIVGFSLFAVGLFFVRSRYL